MDSTDASTKTSFRFHVISSFKAGHSTVSDICIALHTHTHTHTHMYSGEYLPGAFLLSDELTEIAGTVKCLDTIDFKYSTAHTHTHTHMQ